MWRCKRPVCEPKIPAADSMGARLHGVKGIEQMLQSKAQFVKAGQLAPIGRVCPGFLGERCLNQDFRDLGISGIAEFLHGGSFAAG